MTAAALARSAYADPRAAALTPRQAEYRVFARVTHRLAEAEVALEVGAPDAFPRLVAALEDDRRLWSALAADLAAPGNRLPERLRADLLSLALFVEREVRRVRAREAGPRALIVVNEAVMKGLRARAEAA